MATDAPVRYDHLFKVQCARLAGLRSDAVCSNLEAGEGGLRLALPVCACSATSGRKPEPAMPAAPASPSPHSFDLIRSN